MKKFKPMLAPNDSPNLDEINYPILASYKLDGVRCIFYKGEMLSRSLKPIPNKQLREKFQSLTDFSKEHDCILDGEIYSPDLTFQEIIGFVMTQDFEDKKSIKKHGEILKIPEDLKFYCFDCVEKDDFNISFEYRHSNIINCSIISSYVDKLLVLVRQKKLTSKEEVEIYFEEALNFDNEGLILKDLNGRYKCGRGTLKEGLIYKVKLFKTIDAEIIDIIQATKVDPKAEKQINELNRSVTSKKKNDRILIEKAAAFVVEYKGQKVKVSIAMDDAMKEEIWTNKNKYIGKIVEYKFMEVGMKDLPRHPTTVRMRNDKN